MLERPSATVTDSAPPAATGGGFLLPSADFWGQVQPLFSGTRYLSFGLSSGSFALPLAHVREVDRVPTVSPLPNVPPWVLGAANIRGEIISVVDLAAFLELPQRAHTTRQTEQRGEARLIAVRTTGVECGLVVERVGEIREIPNGALRAVRGSTPGRSADYLIGAVANNGSLTLVLDVARLLQAREFRQFE